MQAQLKMLANEKTLRELDGPMNRKLSQWPINGIVRTVDHYTLMGFSTATCAWLIKQSSKMNYNEGLTHKY